GVETSVNRLAELLAAAAQRPPQTTRAPARAGELLRSVLAVDKAARELGWRPRTSLAEGLQATVRFLAEGRGVLLQVGRAVPTTPWDLVLTSSRETKFVLAVLVVFSLVSWYLIFLKWWQFRRTRRQADRFMAQIEKAARLEDAYHAAMRLPSSPYNRLLREAIHCFSEP